MLYQYVDETNRITMIGLTVVTRLTYTTLHRTPTSHQHLLQLHHRSRALPSRPPGDRPSDPGPTTLGMMRTMVTSSQLPSAGFYRTTERNHSSHPLRTILMVRRPGTRRHLLQPFMGRLLRCPSCLITMKSLPLHQSGPITRHHL
jgi:hypothetical protein